MGRRTKGTGLAGSEMYSSYAASPALGASGLRGLQLGRELTGYGE